MESLPDGLWNIENVKMFAVDRSGSDGIPETVRFVVGHHACTGMLITMRRFMEI
jgi:hypothetical protein